MAGLWRAGMRQWVGRLAVLVAFASAVPPAQVLALRFVDPLFTLTMVEVAVAQGRWVDVRPVSLSAQGRLARAALAAEDGAFFYHYGVDVGGVCTALGRNRDAGRVVAGGSTITQQTAKNVFLWQGRSWVRKGLEAYYVLWMELLLPKRRILEVYLNVAELGPGVFGGEAAAQRWYKAPASALSTTQAARIISLLPNPKQRRPEGADAGQRAASIVRRDVPWPGEKGFEQVGDAWRERSWRQCGW